MTDSYRACCVTCAVPTCRYMTIMHEAATAKYELATSIAIWLFPLLVAMLPLFDVLGRSVTVEGFTRCTAVLCRLCH